MSHKFYTTKCKKTKTLSSRLRVLLLFTDPEPQIAIRIKQPAQHTLLLGKSLGTQRRKIHRVLLLFTNPEPEIRFYKKQPEYIFEEWNSTKQVNIVHADSVSKTNSVFG